MNEEFEINKEVSNNLGEIFKKTKLETELGSKLVKKEQELKEIKEILDSMDGVTLNEIKVLYVSLIKMLYEGNNLEKQKVYLENTNDYNKILQSAWNIYLSRIEQVEKLKEKLEI